MQPHAAAAAGRASAQTGPSGPSFRACLAVAVIVCLAAASSFADAASDWRLDSSGLGSTGPPPPRSTDNPNYGSGVYMGISLAILVVVTLLLCALFSYFPTHLLLKLGCALYGFEPVVTLYQTRDKNKADIKIKGFDADVVQDALKHASAASPDGSGSSSGSSGGNAAFQRKPLASPSSSPSARLSLDAAAGASSSNDLELNQAAPDAHGMSHRGETTPVPSTPALEQASRRQHKPLLNMYLHSNTLSLWVMGRTVDFNASAIAEEERLLDEEEEDEASHGRCHRCSHACDFSLRCGCYHRGRCGSPKMGRSERVKRFLKLLLFSSTFVCLNLFVALAILPSNMNRLADNATECPSTVRESAWDCFLFSDYSYTQSYVDCSVELPVMQFNYRTLACFRFLPLSAETCLESISTIASLFTLVFGGMGTAFGWILLNVRTRRRVRMMYAIPISLFVTWLMMTSLGLLHTSLAIMTPLCITAITVDLINIRMTVGFDEDHGDEAAADPDEDRQEPLHSEDEDDDGMAPDGPAFDYHKLPSARSLRDSYARAKFKRPVRSITSPPARA